MVRFGGGGAHTNSLLPQAYVSNKAGLTGQTVPGRRISGHWPYLGPDELAETEPVFARTRDVFLSFTPPRARAGQARPAWPHLDFSMSRLPFGLPALLLGLARAARCPAQGGSRPRSLGGVKDGTTGKLAVPWRPRASAGRTHWPNPEIRCLTHRITASRYALGAEGGGAARPGAYMCPPRNCARCLLGGVGMSKKTAR